MRKFKFAPLIAGVMHLRAMLIDGRRFIVHYHYFLGHSFSERLPFGVGVQQVVSFFVAFEYEPSGSRLTPFLVRGFREGRSLWLSASSQGSQSGLAFGMGKVQLTQRR
ncbi:hypothetical protein [Photobacterium alginatilyticum]|uniref:Uncharacterized protein n=1 Tax=Photobacterium alginatilyticum TaxID=1775171 RepID=A0ABW9YQN9_9GAMM|nr:hypothetical protein [Photobacterium alginatilyticum]NBI56274.1 hypothetical protein [Photobacterium alginatilyticum]